MLPCIAKSAVQQNQRLTRSADPILGGASVVSNGLLSNCHDGRNPCLTRKALKPPRFGSLIIDPRSTLRVIRSTPIGLGGSIGSSCSSAITIVGTDNDPTSSRKI